MIFDANTIPKQAGTITLTHVKAHSKPKLVQRDKEGEGKNLIIVGL